MLRALKTAFLMLLAGVFLAGCSSLRVLESDVSAFSAWTAAPPTPGTPYRFERLPSQLLASAQQDRIESMAVTSLARVGMVLDPSAARFSVQVALSTRIGERFQDDGFPMLGSGLWMGGAGMGSSIGMAYPIRFSEPYYKREVSVLMRELSSQKVVYETRAVNAGPWSDSLALLPAMLDSALLGFPQPPAGLRRVNVDIPR